MEIIYNLTVKANDGKIFKYIVDPLGLSLNYGSQLNDVNIKPIEGNIKLITKNIIGKMKIDINIVNELDDIDWNFEGTEGKYFDHDGLIYRNIENEIYPSIWKSNYLSKYFDEL